MARTKASIIPPMPRSGFFMRSIVIRSHRRSRDAASDSSHLPDRGAAHFEARAFRIGVDPKDGLLRQGAEGYQLTWMDAKVDGWVVTPRRGKAVEINALWYNALRLARRMAARIWQSARRRKSNEHADQTRVAFNQRFWSEEAGYPLDVVDGEEGKTRLPAEPDLCHFAAPSGARRGALAGRRGCGPRTAC